MKEFRDLANIRLRVVPRESPIARSPAGAARPSRLSAKAAEVVARSAGSISDPGLRAALERLAGSAGDSRTIKRRS